MKVKVKFEKETGKILGYFPENILYEKIDLIKKTIDNFPFIEIEQNQQNTDEEMVVINNVYQIFKKSNEQILKDAKIQKLAELNNFHASESVKIFTIKLANGASTKISVDADTRYLLDEQISLLNFKKIQGETDPKWLYQNGIDMPLNLTALVGIRLYIGALVDANFKAKKIHEKAIPILKTIDEIEKYDLKIGYRLNQILSF